MLAAALALGTACGKNQPSKTDNTATEASRNASASNMVTLTAEQIKTIGITLDKVGMRELSSVVKANGVISVLNQHKALITSPFGGTVKSIQVHSGASVKAGDVIATISNPIYLTVQEEYLTIKAQSNAGNTDAIAAIGNPQYANLSEQYRTLQPQIEMAELELKRQRELNAGNAGSAKNLQQAEANCATLTAKRNTLQSQIAIFGKNAEEVLKTKRAALENKLRLMGISPQNLTPETMQSTLAVRSPITGKVGEISAKIGAYLTENNAIAEVVDLNSLHLDLNIYEPDLPKFRIGQIIQFTLINNPAQTYSAKIHTIGAMLDPVTKTIEIHAHIEGNKTGLIEGMNATATAHAGNAKVMAVPNAAIVNEGGQDYIFVKQTGTDIETVFEKTPVRTGASEAGFTEIALLTFIPENALIATSQAFFILGKMTNNGEE